MKKLFLFVFVILLCFCTSEVLAEEIAENPTPDQEEVLRYLQGEDIYQGTLSWQGNKLSSKFNYEIKKEKIK